MYTKEQLRAMSDFEVNVALCALLGKDVSGICELRNQMTGAVTDFCNNTNDIMPLAFEREVCLLVSKIGGIAFLFEDADGDFEFEDKNPLRAIACCLIMVLQERDK